MTVLDPDQIWFPHPSTANAEGVVAIGGDLTSERLLTAYRLGYFPWYNPGDPIIWWHPDPRFVIFPGQVRITKSMKPYFRQERFRLTFDQEFDKVVYLCEQVLRKDQLGTWITEEIKTAYSELHHLGVAHSVEVWEDDLLVGGLYGVSLGKMFFGESMFSAVSNASKFALISLSSILHRKGFELIDCQMPNPHLKRMGGQYIPRSQFMERLESNFDNETILGSWEDSMNVYPVPQLIETI